MEQPSGGGQPGATPQPQPQPQPADLTLPTAGSTSLARTTGTGCGTGRTEQVPAPAAYASWLRRSAAGLIGGLPALLAAALLIPGYVTSLLAAGRTRSLGPDWASGTGWLTAGLVTLLVVVVWTVLNRWWWQGRTGHSLGKRALGLTLLGDWTRAPVGMAHVALRDLVHALDDVTVIGYLWPLWDPRRQTLADKLTRTVVTSARRPG